MLAWPRNQPAAEGVSAATAGREWASFLSSAWLVALLVAGAAAYLPALWGVFYFDDITWILHNSRVDFASFDFSQRRPLTLLSFAANLYVAGPNPAGFHAVNIVLHLANTALVYVLVGRTLPRARAMPVIAALAAALFLLHPVQTGAVSYASGRPTSLMTFCLLIAHLSALATLRTQGPSRLAVSLVAFVLAVAAKETALAYPAIWLGWLLVGDRLPLRHSLRLAAPHLIVAAILFGAMLMHPGYRSLLAEAGAAGTLATTPTGIAEQRVGLGFCFNDGKPRADSCVARRVESVAGLSRFFVAPWTLSIDPGRRPADFFDLCIVALVAWAAWRALRSRSGGVAAGAAWCVAALLPTAVIFVRSDPVADRLLYLPMVGLALILGGVLARARPVVLAAAGATLLVLASLTWERNVRYQSDVALWQEAVEKNPANPRAHVNLGVALESRGEFDGAAAEYDGALRLRPGLSWAERGTARIRQIREEEVSP